MTHLRQLMLKKCYIMAKGYGNHLYPDNCADIILHCFALPELANKTVDELDQMIMNIMATVDGGSAVNDFTRAAAETLHERIRSRTEIALSKIKNETVQA